MKHKKWRKGNGTILSISLILLLSLLTAGCASEESAKTPTTKPTLSTDGSTTLSATYDISKTLSLTFTSSDAWTIDASDDEMSVSPNSGKAGTNTVSIQLQNYNCTNVNYDYFLTVKSENSIGSTSMKITVSQAPVFVLKDTYFEADPEGDNIEVKFNTDGNVKSGFWIYYSQGDAEEMLAKEESSRADDYKYTGTIPITKNTEQRQRNGYFAFGLDQNAEQLSTTFQITQLPSSIECSTDTVTNDGVVQTLQQHTTGKGIPLIIMGDGFIDREVADGTYDDACRQAFEYFFSINPMTKLKEYFDVYEVTAVSYNNVFSSSTRTAFSSVFTGGSSTEVKGNNDKVIEYAEKAIAQSRINDATVLVILNDTRHAGTCVLYTSPTKSEIPSGLSLAFIPMTEYSEATQSGFEQILHHEAVGHGFAKLADEYNNEENGTIPEDTQKELEDEWNYGFARNLSTTSDVTKTFWADLAADEHYTSEKLGCYEGGFTYAKGVWRATDENIMRENIGGFNAQQRRLIYNRCMKIANGTSWKPDYDAFVAFDQPASSSSAKNGLSKQPSKRPTMHLRPTPPRIVKATR